MKTSQNYHPQEDLDTSFEGGSVPSYHPGGDTGLDELLGALRGVQIGESTPPNSEMLVVPGKGVFLKDGKGKYRMVNLAEQEWQGKARLSKSTKKTLQRYKKLGKELPTGKKRKRRKSSFVKKRAQARYQRTSPVACEFEAKRYRQRMSDPVTSWTLMSQLKAKQGWEITLEEWVEYVWPVYSKHFVWIRRWDTKKPFSLENLFLQLHSEHPSKYINYRQRLRPTGVVLDGAKIRLEQLGLLVEGE